jgi:hypothetical protein
MFQALKERCTVNLHLRDLEKAAANHLQTFLLISLEHKDRASKT